MTRILNFSKRIYRRLFLEYVKKFPRYKINTFDQEQIFDEIGLSRSDGLTKLNNILADSKDRLSKRQQLF